MASETYVGPEGFTLAELVDLSLGTPEVGAVNFNILRIFLHELLRNMRLTDVVADLNDLQASQIDHFRTYLMNHGSASPFPGVMKYSQNPSGPGIVTHNGFAYHRTSTPTNNSSERLNNQLPSAPNSARQQQPQYQQRIQPQLINPQQQQLVDSRGQQQPQNNSQRQQINSQQPPNNSQQQQLDSQQYPQNNAQPQQIVDSRQPQQIVNSRQQQQPPNSQQQRPPVNNNQRRNQNPNQSSQSPATTNNQLQQQQVQSNQSPAGTAENQNIMNQTAIPSQQHQQQGPQNQRIQPKGQVTNSNKAAQPQTQTQTQGPTGQQQPPPLQPSQNGGQPQSQQPQQNQFVQGQVNNQQWEEGNNSKNAVQTQEPTSQQQQQPPQNPQNFPNNAQSQPTQPLQNNGQFQVNQQPQNFVNNGPPSQQNQPIGGGGGQRNNTNIAGQPQGSSGQQPPLTQPMQNQNFDKGQQTQNFQNGAPQRSSQPTQNPAAPAPVRRPGGGGASQAKQRGAGNSLSGQRIEHQQVLMQVPGSQAEDRGQPLPNGGLQGQEVQVNSYPGEGQRQTQARSQPNLRDRQPSRIQRPNSEGGQDTVPVPQQQPQYTPPPTNTTSVQIQPASPSSSTNTPRTPSVGRVLKKLEDKIAKLENHLEILYALPQNADLLNTIEGGHGFNVNDMWQIIQLNNRTAAAEAAIQKLASLIEDMARQLKNIKQHSEISIKSNDQLATQLGPINERFHDTQQALNTLRNDLERYREQMTKEMELVNKSNLANIPSFMQQAQRVSITSSGGSSGHSTAGGVNVNAVPLDEVHIVDLDEETTEQDILKLFPKATKVAIVQNFNGAPMAILKYETPQDAEEDFKNSRLRKIAPRKLDWLHPEELKIENLPNEISEENLRKMYPDAIGIKMRPDQGQSIVKFKTNEEALKNALATPHVVQLGERAIGWMKPNENYVVDVPVSESEQNIQARVPLTNNVKWMNMINSKQAAITQHPDVGARQQAYLKSTLPKKGPQEMTWTSSDAEGIGKYVLGPNGEILLDENGQPYLLSDVILGPDGRPILGPDGKPIRKNMVMLDQFGNPILDKDGKSVLTKDVLWNPSTGKPYLDKHGNPVLLRDVVFDENGLPMFGRNGQPVLKNEFVMDDNGQFVLDKYGNWIRASQILYDENGKPLRDEHGNIVRKQDANKATSGKDAEASQNAGQGSDGPESKKDNTKQLVPGQSDKDQKMSGDLIGQTKHSGHHGSGATANIVDGADGKSGPIPVVVVSSEHQQGVGKFGPEFEATHDSLKLKLAEGYNELQDMQRQLTSDIQDKMEFIYQKLLREVANQQMTSSPYMAIGPGLGKCMGPGICTGHGMPAGTAVCQFPAVDEASRLTSAYRGCTDACAHCHGTGKNPLGPCSHCLGTGHTKVGGQQQQQEQHPCPQGLQDVYKVCPGPGICPGVGVCPTCKDDVLHSLRPPTSQGLDRPLDPPRSTASHHPGEKPLENDAQLQDLLKKECKTLILLPKDLEELREKVKTEGKVPNVFDEIDILERLHTIWDAVTSLKHNDEALAVRMIKLDAALKKFPRGAVMEKIQRIPPENLDAIASASPDRPLIIPSVTSLGHGSGSGEEDDCTNIPLHGGKKGMTGAGGGGVAEDDIQTIFNNLSNLLVESAAQKEQLEGAAELIKSMEQNMVTKHMLIDAMSDKADKGQMNTKVSYDEFGNSMDELTTRMQNLLIEVYQKNENWKNITDHLGEELTAKLDKVELAPVRAYFKSHLKTLEERVNYLTAQLEEPDPAGTRKKILKDYNCISCDRHTHISGVTNASQLPTFGPILAGHTTASQRAYDLHRMRQQKICKFGGGDGRDMNLVSKELCRGGPRGSSVYESAVQSMNDSDVMNMVNRYVGGSHTSVTTSDRIAAMQKRISNIKSSGEAVSGSVSQPSNPSNNFTMQATTAPTYNNSNYNEE